MKNLLLLSSLLLALFSCNKDRISQCSDNNLLSQVKAEDLVREQYVYNGACKIHELIEPYKYTRFSYDNSNRLVKKEEASVVDPLSCYMPVGADAEVTDPRKAKISYYTEFDYDSVGKLKSASRYFSNETVILTSYTLYEYTDNQIIKSKIYASNNMLTMYHSFTYDEAGNVIKDDFYYIEDGGIAQLQYTTEYEFDNKINPFALFRNSSDPGINTNTNNILRQKLTSYGTGNPDVNYIDYLIEYNADGYPKKINNLTLIYGN